MTTPRTNFHLVSTMNEAYNNAKGDPANIDWNRIRNQTTNVFDEFIETMKALGLKGDAIAELKAVRQKLTLDRFDQETVPVLKNVRDGLVDMNVFSYGSHHMMGIDADRDMKSVISGVMTRFIRDEADKAATIAKHAANGVTQVYFEGNFPAMIMKSAANQPDAPVGKFLKSASYSEPQFYDPLAEAEHQERGALAQRQKG